MIWLHCLLFAQPRARCYLVGCGVGHLMAERLRWLMAVWMALRLVL